MVAFNDLDKKAGGVLRVGYCHQKPWQVNVAHSGDNPKFSAFGTVTNNTLDAAPSIRYTSNGITLDAKAGSTSSLVDLTYNFPKTCGQGSTCKALPILSGLSFGSKLQRTYMKGAPADSTTLSLGFRHSIFEAKATLNPHSCKWTQAQCFTYDKLPYNGAMMFGAEASGDGKEFSSFNCSVGAAYTSGSTKPWALALKTSSHEGNPIGKLTGSIFAASEKGNSLAAEVCHTIATNKSTVTLGGLMYLNPGKYDTYIKAKIMPDAKVATVFCHKFSDNLTGNFGCQFSAAKQDAESLSYGIKLGLTV